MLLVLIGGLLLFGIVTGTATFTHVLWATAGITTIVAITSAIMGTLLPYSGATRRWARFTEKVGNLELQSWAGLRPPSVSGRVGRCHVTISLVEREQLVVMSLPSSAANIAHHDITLETRTSENRDAPSLTLGDPAFDPFVVLRGSLPEVVAVLDAKARASVLRMLDEESVEIRKRQVLRYGRRLEIDPEATWRSLSAMADLSEHLFLVSPSDVRARLLENATNDPLIKVRALNLLMLFEYYPPDQRVLMLGRLALSSGHPDLALAGAQGLAETGDAVDRARALEWLGVASRSPIGEIANAAIDLLSMHFALEARPILEEIEKENGPLPAALLPALARAGVEPDMGRLVDRARRSGDAIKLDIARRLPEHGSRFERLATAMLEESPEEVQLELIEGLIRTGTIDAVAPLLPLTKGVLRSKRVKERAELAIRAIQSKLAHSDAGQLSLSSAHRGELSVEDARGGLSPSSARGRDQT
jgi:hypothetical protein